MLDKATNLNSNIHITDSQSGFRAFARHTIPIFRFKSSGFGIESEMLSDAAEAGLRIMEVEIGVKYDLNGSTEHPLRHGIGVLMKIINDMEYRRPLFYFTIPGILICVFGITLGLMFFGNYIYGGSTSLLPTVLAVLLTIAGSFLVLTGIILHSMSRMINNLIPNFNQNLNAQTPKAGEASIELKSMQKPVKDNK